jgi:hypothetical protein
MPPLRQCGAGGRGGERERGGEAAGLGGPYNPYHDIIITLETVGGWVGG